MKTKILMLAAFAALVSCNSGSTLEKEIGKSLSKAENIKGYEFIEQAVSKNATIDDCLSWEAKTAKKSLTVHKSQCNSQKRRSSPLPYQKQEQLKGISSASIYCAESFLVFEENEEGNLMTFEFVLMESVALKTFSTIFLGPLLLS